MELELGSAENEETREKSPRSRFSEEEANIHGAKNVP